LNERVVDKDEKYLGYITFEKPGSLFTYSADSAEHLNGEEVTELIES
jgi:hypothetical protein